ncbi:MAG: hypothetical protein AABZ15_13205 [Nitrospirota bacterium]
MKKLSLLTNMLMLAGTMVVLAWGTGFAAPPPPPPPVPAGDLFTHLAAGGGIAAYGAYHLWRAKRSVRKQGKDA